MPFAIETERLTIKTLNKDYANMVLSFYEDNKLYFEPWEPERNPNFYTLSYQKASLSAEHYQMSEGKLLRYWVFRKANPEEIIGSVCFQNFLREPYHSCSLGYKLDYRYLHQGYALECISKCIENVFEECQTHRIEAYIMANNTPSLRLIERLGFRYEGLSVAFARISGVWTDHKRYSLINTKDLTPYYSLPKADLSHPN